MASVTNVFSISGKHNKTSGSSQYTGAWHVLSSSLQYDDDALIAGGLIRCSRDTSSTTVTIHDGGFYSSLHNYSGYASFGYSITWALIRGGTQYSDNNPKDGDNRLLYDGTILLQETWGANNGSGSRTFDPNNASTHLSFSSSTNEILYICYLCGQSGGCQQGYAGLSGHGDSEWVIVGEIDTSTIPYNPYTPPSLSINSHKDLGVYNKANDYNINYTVTLGTNSLDWLRLYIYNSSNTYLTYKTIDRTATGSNKSFTYTLNGNSNIGHGGHYKIKLRLSDNVQEYETGFYDIHSCHEPTVSDLNLWTDGSSSATKITSFSPQNNIVEFWWTQNGNTKNTERWTDQGENEKTNELRTYTNTTKHSINPGNNNRFVTMTTSNINTLFPTNERNVDSLTKTVTIARTQNQIPKTVTASKDITLQLKPTKSPTDFDILNTSDQSIKSAIQGQLINKNTYASVKLKWNYPYSDIAAGIISGYRIQIYEDSTYTHQYGDNIDFDTANYSNVKYTLNVKTKCKSLVMNYVKITPYYKDGNGTKRLGTNNLRATLFSPYGNINTPIIDYPINNTKWHNKNFRILFQLPEDEDYDSSQSQTYRYNDIEVQVYGYSNLISQTYNYTWTNYAFMYNTDILSYQKKIVINPSLTTTSGNLSIGGLGNFTNYRMKVRVAKTVSNSKVWSSWSSEITIQKEELEPLEVGGEDYVAIYNELNEILNESDSYTSPGDTNITIYNELNAILNESDPYSGGGQGTITVGGIIRAAHYNTIRNYSLQLYNVYPMFTLNSNNVEVAIGDIILHDYYQGIYETILNIQSYVNGYATFDSNRNNVKFNQVINLLSNTEAPIRGEIITAERDLRPGSGRDYLLLLYDSMSLLY